MVQNSILIGYLNGPYFALRPAYIDRSRANFTSSWVLENMLKRKHFGIKQKRFSLLSDQKESNKYFLGRKLTPVK